MSFIFVSQNYRSVNIGGITAKITWGIKTHYSNTPHAVGGIFDITPLLHYHYYPLYIMRFTTHRK